jgi:hypothetical protein
MRLVKIANKLELSSLDTKTLSNALGPVQPQLPQPRAQPIP